MALEAGADDVSTEGDLIEVITSSDDFHTVVDALEAAEFETNSAELQLIPDATVTLTNAKTAKALSLIDKIEDNDDVQSVSTNLEIPDDFDPDVEY